MTIEEIISQLRAEEKAVYGDGFGYAGDLKSRYKKTLRALDELQEKLKEPPPAEVRESGGKP